MQPEMNCPNCGALIGTGEPGLPVVTCGFCNSLLSKAGDELSKVGEAGRVPFDVSPLQIGTRLTVDGTRGEIVGRERWAWDRGFWNEWLLQFPNGTTRWVAEEAGLYMIMEEIEGQADEVANLASIDVRTRSAMGAQIWIGGVLYTVSDMKVIRCVAVEGSLPHVIGAQYARESIDLRTASRKAVTWQKDGSDQSLWRGAYYRLEDLAPSGLRSFEHWSAPAFEAAR